jgi:16S rRNA C967 or C1407 C5-methylase (RsmB/RsmF family)
MTYRRPPVSRIKPRKPSRDSRQDFEAEFEEEGDEQENRTDERVEQKKAVKVEVVSKAFQKLWSEMFQGTTHLDSALSKTSKNLKSILAQITPAILLRPVSSAQAMGIGVPADEPWKLNSQGLANWRPATLLAERMYGMLERGRLQVEAENEDFPPAMREEWTSTWGKSVTEELTQTLSQDPPLSLRASGRVGAAELLKKLKSTVPVKTQVSDFAPFGVRLASYSPVLGSDIYKEGGFEIQDEGSQVMALFALWPDRFAKVLTTKPGRVAAYSFTLPKETPAWTVVDACAGAGGKSLAIADALRGKGRVYAYDTIASKLSALRRRAKNAQLNNIQTVAVVEGKESEVAKRFRARADVVLVDAPCSGWGVLRRNPDIKWRQTREVLERMPVIQKRLLAAYAPLVAPGGRLVFGVCTFRKAETLDIVADFLSAHPDFTRGEGGFLGPGPCDGFFMQAFQKRS